MYMSYGRVNSGRPGKWIKHSSFLTVPQKFKINTAFLSAYFYHFSLTSRSDDRVIIFSIDTLLRFCAKPANYSISLWQRTNAEWADKFDILLTHTY